MVVFFDPDTIGNRKGFCFREDGRAGIAFFVGIVPVLVVAGQVQLHLSGLDLRGVRIEDQVIIREGGVENLIRVTHDLIEL